MHGQALHLLIARLWNRGRRRLRYLPFPMHCRVLRETPPTAGRPPQHHSITFTSVRPSCWLCRVASCRSPQQAAASAAQERRTEARANPNGIDYWKAAHLDLRCERRRISRCSAERQGVRHTDRIFRFWVLYVRLESWRHEDTVHESPEDLPKLPLAKPSPGDSTHLWHLFRVLRIRKYRETLRSTPPSPDRSLQRAKPFSSPRTKGKNRFVTRDDVVAIAHPGIVRLTTGTMIAVAGVALLIYGLVHKPCPGGNPGERV